MRGLQVIDGSAPAVGDWRAINDAEEPDIGSEHYQETLLGRSTIDRFGSAEPGSRTGGRSGAQAGTRPD